MKYLRLLFTAMFFSSAYADGNNVIRDFVESDSWLLIDPLFNNVDRFDIAEVHSSNFSISRILPSLDNIAIEGADRIITLNNGVFHNIEVPETLLPTNSFRVPPHLAIEQAILHTNGSLIAYPSIQKLPPAQKVWLMHRNQLRAAYKVRIPTLRLPDLKNFWIDAESNDILKIEPAAKFVDVPTRVFLQTPSSDENLVPQLNNAELPDLVSNAPGQFLQGNHIHTLNCCKYYTCPNNVSSCSLEQRRCAFSGYESRRLLKVPEELLSISGFPDEYVYINTVQCAGIPLATIPQSGSLYLTPIDGPQLEAESDAFAEVQAYHTTTSFFYYIRNLLDETFCLRPQAMHCDKQGNPILKNGLPEKTFPVFVNQVLPDLKIDRSQIGDPDFFYTQVHDGRGTRSNPVILSDFIRFANAAFIPALEPSPEIGSIDEILIDFNRNYDHLLIFQGNEVDFSYDVDVINHEFMHAVTQTLNPFLATFLLDSQGTSDEAGALNEALSDYFAASYSGSSTIGQYAAVEVQSDSSLGLRNINSLATCKSDFTNEVHEDSLIYSSALWEVRKQIMGRLGEAGARAFDTTVLVSVAQSTPTENFSHHALSIVNLIEGHAQLGPPIAQLARSIFNTRGIIDCIREFDLSTVASDNSVQYNNKSHLFLSSPLYFGLKNYSPAPVQLKVNLPRGASSFTLSWDLFLDAGGGLVATTQGRKIKPLAVIALQDEPITWDYRDDLAIPYKGNQRLEFNPETDENQAITDGTKWHHTYRVNPDFCNVRTVYVSVLTLDLSYALKDIDVTIQTVPTPTEVDCPEVVATSFDADGNDSSSSGCNSNHAGHTQNATLIVLLMTVSLMLKSGRRLKKKIPPLKKGARGI